MLPISSPYDEAGARDEPGLFTVLASAARRRTDGALALWAGIGGAIAIVLAFTSPDRWVTLCIALTACAFGLWGIIDRELTDALRAERRARALRALRASIAIVGCVAGALAILGGFAAALGTWIS